MLQLTEWSGSLEMLQLTEWVARDIAVDGVGR